MNALIRPRTIAVIGASPKRQTLGNVALDNLANYKFAGKVIPVHAEAPEIAGLAAVPAIEALPDDVDVALASVPAAGVADVVRRLDRRGYGRRSSIPPASRRSRRRNCGFSWAAAVS